MTPPKEHMIEKAKESADTHGAAWAYHSFGDSLRIELCDEGDMWS